MAPFTTKRFVASFGGLAPPGVTPNYVNPVNNGKPAAISGIVLLAVAILLVIFRIFSKLFGSKMRLRWDDWTAIIAVVFATARIVGVSVDVYVYGMGRHIWDVVPEQISTALRLKILDDIFYHAAILFAKISILLFYLNIFYVNRRFRILAYCTIVFVSLYLLAGMFSLVFQCRPMSKTWNWSGPLPTHCNNGIQQSASIGGFNIGTDLWLIFMPLPMVWQLQMSKRNKFGLLFVFCLGLLTVIAAILREYFVLTTLRNADVTWTEVHELLWLNIEMNIGIICGSLLTLPPLYRRVLDSRFGSTIRSLFHSKRGSGRTTVSASKKVPSQTDTESTTHINGQYMELDPIGHTTKTVIGSEVRDIEASRLYSKEDFSRGKGINLRREVDVTSEARR